MASGLPQWVIDEIGEPPPRPSQEVLARAREGNETDAERQQIRAWREWSDSWNSLRTRAASEGRWKDLGLLDEKEKGKSAYSGARAEWQNLLRDDPKAKAFANSAAGKAYAQHFGGGDLGSYLGFMRYNQMQEDLKKNGIGFDHTTGLMYNKGASQSNDPKTWSWFDAFGEKVNAPAKAFGGAAWSPEFAKVKNLDAAFGQATKLGWDPSRSQAAGGDYGDTQQAGFNGGQGFDTSSSTLARLLGISGGNRGGSGGGQSINWNNIDDPDQEDNKDQQNQEKEQSLPIIEIISSLLSDSNDDSNSDSNSLTGIGKQQQQQSELDKTLAALFDKLQPLIYSSTLTGNKQQLLDLLIGMTGLGKEQQGEAYANPMINYMRDLYGDVLGVKFNPASFDPNQIFEGLSATDAASGQLPFAQYATGSGPVDPGGRDFRSEGEFPELTTPGQGSYRLTRTGANPNDSKSFGLLAPMAGQLGSDTANQLRTLERELPKSGVSDLGKAMTISNAYGQLGGLRQGLMKDALGGIQNIANQAKFGVPFPGYTGSQGTAGMGLSFGQGIQGNEASKYSTYMNSLLKSRENQGGSFMDTLMKFLAAVGPSVVSAIKSDKGVKRDVKPHTAGLSALHKIQPKSYKYNGKGGTVDGQPGVSVMAQDLEKVLPEAVTMMETTDPHNPKIKGIFPMKLLMTTINAVKELDDKVEHKLSSYKGKK